jgi:hypothetical protein
MQWHVVSVEFSLTFLKESSSSVSISVDTEWQIFEVTFLFRDGEFLEQLNSPFVSAGTARSRALIGSVCI